MGGAHSRKLHFFDPGNSGSRIRSVSLQLIWVVAIAIVFAAASARDVAAQVNSLCSGSPTADCTDVTADGISYTDGTVTEVNVGDGVAGETVVTPGTIGIELTRAGAFGSDADVEATFQVLEDYDIDPTPGVTLADVVSSDGVAPLLVEDEFIFSDGGDPPPSSRSARTITRAWRLRNS